MVGLSGFEPPTSPLSGVRSNQLSYRPLLLPISPIPYFTYALTHIPKCMLAHYSSKQDRTKILVTSHMQIHDFIWWS